MSRALTRILGLGLVIGAVKGALGLLGGSLSLMADGLLGLGEGGAALVALLHHGIGAARPDRDHPYGHQKLLALGALAGCVLPLFVGVEILQAALARWQGAGAAGLPVLRPGPAGWAVLALVLLAQLGLWRWSLRRAAQLASPVLQLRSRGLGLWSGASGLVLLGLVMAATRGWGRLDLLLALPVLLLLVLQCWRVIQQLLPELEDRIAIPPEAIHAAVLAVPGVLNAHDIGSRGVLGQLVFVDMHLVVDADDLPTAHRITELVEEHLEARFGPLRCNIHLEPREYASDRITFHGAHG
ncbi:cation efflux system protein [Cyanobium sp. PCC 7001]|uniref:cation diffusion facilitator family transporter n=1 Tax=Cyanobium sp. PCC 7001 TaxID=180281 RepID=UPI0001804C42|nr:cation diffusion facilitator family transporter [Cyanobium sp. PCC 7001]EDY39701.1 cation efflux system protein [Cyanobium sp. PCC 7001]